MIIANREMTSCLMLRIECLPGTCLRGIKFLLSSKELSQYATSKGHVIGITLIFPRSNCCGGDIDSQFFFDLSSLARLISDFRAASTAAVLCNFI